MELTEILTQILAGAFTGYTTNSLAIKMLFKSYGPFGGVIVKTREDFIKNISQLIEKDIIKAHTLENTLKRPEVNDSIRELVGGFFSNTLAKDIHMKDIRAIDKTYSNFSNYLSTEASTYIHKAMNVFLTKIRFENLITEEEFALLNKKISKNFIEITAESQFLNNQVEILFSDIKDRKINSFFDKKLLDQFNNNLKYIINNSKNKDNMIGQYTNTFIHAIYNEIYIEELKDKLFLIIKNKRLQDYNFNRSYFINIKDKTLNKLNSKKFKNSLSSIIRKNQNIEFKKLLDQNIKEDIKNISIRKIELISKDINEYLHENKSEINQIFNGLIDKTFKEEELISPFKTAIKRSAYQVYRKNNDINFSEMLANSLNNLIKEEKTQEKIHNYLLKNIENIDLNINPDDISKKIILEIKNYLQDIPKDLINDLESLKISKLVNLDDLPSLIDLIANNQEIQNFFLELITSKMDNILINFSKSSLSDYFSDNDFKLLCQKLSKKSRNKIEKIEKILELEVYNKYKDKPLSLLKFNLEKTNFKENLNIFLKKQEKNINNIQLNKILADIANNTAYHDKISKSLIIYINENLEFLLKGNIAEAIKNNLEKISDKEIKDILEDFVGKELKPITYFGAFLGIFTALLLYLLQSNLHLDQNFYLPIYMLVYGFIGYITNVIAIKMIFRPYQKKQFLGIPIPLTPGVVSKEKERFAQSVGNFIDQELLNHQTLQNTIEDKKDLIEETITNSIKADEYKLLIDFLLKYSSKLANTSLKNIEKHKKNILSSILNTVNDKNKGNLLDLKSSSDKREKTIQTLSNFILNDLLVLFEDNIDNLASMLYSHIEDKNTVSEIIPNNIKENINEKISRLIKVNIDSIIEGLDDNQKNYLESTVIKLIEQIYYNHKEKRIADIPEEIKDRIYQFSYLILSKILLSKTHTITELLNNYLISKSDTLLNETAELIAKNKNYIKNKILEQVETKMGFWSKAGKLVDFEETLDNFADKFIEEGIPEIINLYLKERKNVLLENVQIKEKEFEIIFKNILDNNSCQELYKDNISIFIDNYSKLSLEKILEFLEIKEPSKLISIFSEELRLINKHLAIEVNKEKESLNNILVSYCEDILNEIVYKEKTTNIIKNVNIESMEITIKKTYQELIKNNNLEKIFNYILSELLRLILNEKTLFNKEKIQYKLNNILDSVFEDKELISKLENLLDKIYTDLAKNLANLIEEETTDYLLETIIESLLETLKSGLADLLEIVNLKDISVNEINNMNSQEIEDLFYSFAGGYFGNLEKYGWLGSLVGLLAALLALFA
ncbi:DUF445 family protein [Natronospora cellulosivora (SeqCode)]